MTFLRKLWQWLQAIEQERAALRAELLRTHLPMWHGCDPITGENPGRCPFEDWVRRLTPTNAPEGEEQT